MRLAAFLLTAALANAGQFATSLGDTYPYTISAIATDPAGNTYVTGSRQLTVALNTQTDVFVSKLDPSGNLLFTRVFGGSASSSASAIAVDPTGNIYIAGGTMASDFPLSNALQTQPGGAFIMKLTNDGMTILYSTFFGGTPVGATSVTSLATDSKGNLYLTGKTMASDFPHTPGMPFTPLQGHLQNGVPLILIGTFITSISAAGDKILYSGTLVGTVSAPGPDCGTERGVAFCQVNTYGNSIAVDAAGNAYVAGVTGATDLPTTPGVLSPNGSGGFVAKVNPGGTGLGYLTYLPPTDPVAIAVDGAGNAYLAGSAGGLTTTPGAVFPGPSDGGFLAKLKPDASAFVWATYMGGGEAAVYSIAVDAGGNVWASGLATLSTVPNTNGWTTGTAFVVGLNAAGSALKYSALFPRGTVEQAVAIDPSGVVHVAGPNGFVSAIAPTSAPAMSIFDFQNAFGGNATARISPAEVISIYGPGIGPAAAVTAVPTNGFYPTTLAGVQVTMNGVSIPLLYVSSNQINAVVPMEATIGAGATVRVVNGSTTSPGYPVWIVDSAPQTFSTVLNQDGTINSQANPAKSGSIVTYYATGWQSSFSPLADGQVATAAEDACQGSCQGAPGFTVLYGGAAPGIVAGVTQFNVRVNLGAGYGPVFLGELVWVAQ